MRAANGKLYCSRSGKDTETAQNNRSASRPGTAVLGAQFCGSSLDSKWAASAAAVGFGHSGVFQFLPCWTLVRQRWGVVARPSNPCGNCAQPRVDSDGRILAEQSELGKLSAAD